MSSGTEVYNKVIVVDENDKIIGAEDMFSAIEKNLLRRVSRIFIFNESGEMLIQRRSSTVTSPLRLDQSVGGHVDDGESYLEAAERELMEELGLEGELEEIATSFRTKKFFNGIYRLMIPKDTTINYDTGEVDEIIWFNIDELDEKIDLEPESFTRSFIEAWPMLRDKIIPS